MKLSIIIPVYNIENYISRCLNSIINQNLLKEDYEIVIVDDGSTDNSLEIINEYLERVNLIIYKQENKGAAFARNKGIELASGTYIYFIDGDDYLAEQVLGRFVALMENEKLDVLGFASKVTHIEIEEKITLSSSGLPDYTIMNGQSFIANHKYRNEMWWYLINKKILSSENIKPDPNSVIFL